MKRIAILIVVLLCVLSNVNAIGIKLYVGSVVTVTKDFKTAHYLQLVVCNNTADTVFIPKQQLEHLQPMLTNDATFITEGTALLLFSNVPNMISDLKDMPGMAAPPTQYAPPPVTELDKQRKEDNGRLPNRKVADLECLLFSPGECLTVNSLLLTFPLEFEKLAKLNQLQKEQMQVNMVMPVEYYTHRNPAGKSVILISRSSEELKKAALDAVSKKE